MRAPARTMVRSRAQEITLLPVTAGRRKRSYRRRHLCRRRRSCCRRHRPWCSSSSSSLTVRIPIELSGISCCAVVCSVPVVADAAPFSFVGAILGLLVRQLRQQIRMRPFRVARLGAFLRADAFPQRGRLTHALGAPIACPSGFRTCVPQGLRWRVRGATSHEAVRYAEYAPCPHATRRHPPSPPPRQADSPTPSWPASAPECPGTPPW